MMNLETEKMAKATRAGTRSVCVHSVSGCQRGSTGACSRPGRTLTTSAEGPMTAGGTNDEDRRERGKPADLTGRVWYSPQEAIASRQDQRLGRLRTGLLGAWCRAGIWVTLLFEGRQAAYVMLHVNRMLPEPGD